VTAPAGPRVVLDASALLAWVLQERGQQTIDALLPHATVPASAMVETLYRAADRGHRQSSENLHRDLLALGVQVASLTDADTVRAADLIHASKQSSRPGSLSLGDGLVLATAERLALPVTGGDQHWETLDDLQVANLPFR
jgi:ribonuclease VapC